MQVAYQYSGNMSAMSLGLLLCSVIVLQLYQTMQ